MTNVLGRGADEPDSDGGNSAFSLAIVLLKRRRLIATMGIGGGLLGLALGLTSPRLYMSTVMFIPQQSESGATGLALAASQLGIRVPSGGTWGPPIYVALIRSPGLLEPIALDTFTVAEQGGARVALTDLFKIRAPTAALRSDQAMRAVSSVVTATEDKKLNSVRITVLTKWPSVSMAIADRLIKGVNAFNFETRKSQASSERQFVEIRARDAEHALREAEDREQAYLQGNRAVNIGSPELGFQRDRLHRESLLRQSVYTSLVQSREEAKIREVRDTPVISVLEEPRLAVVGEPRNSVQKGFLGGLVGGAFAVLLAFLSEGAIGARLNDTAEAREFFRLMGELTPSFLKRRPRA